MATWLITVVETPLFVRQARKIWSDTECQEFVLYIAGHPEAGDVIAGTGGVRKVRWSRAGAGKRGGVRVVYFYRDAAQPLYLLLAYAKSRKENLTPDEKRTVREISAAIKGERRSKA